MKTMGRKTQALKTKHQSVHTSINTLIKKNQAHQCAVWWNNELDHWTVSLVSPQGELDIPLIKGLDVVIEGTLPKIIESEEIS
jgi:hypothetical protein